MDRVSLIHNKDFCAEWRGYSSATAAATSAHNIISTEECFTRTYRTYIKPREYGEFLWKFWHSNNVDSTWDDGSYSSANSMGGDWIIEAAFIADGGKTCDGGIVPGTQVQLAFDGKVNKEVRGGEKFWSDPALLDIPEGHLLAFTWTITTKTIGKVIPYNVEAPLMPTFSAEGSCADEESGQSFAFSQACTVMPNLIAYKKDVKKKIGFFGDSITQGVNTKMNEYEFWVSRVADGLGNEYGVWNMGSGWARAYDAATDGTWLYKAKQNDQVVICLGVNDIGTGKRSYEQLLGDLTSIINLLKENNPQCEIILCTVPPFEFQGEEETVWRRINHSIRANSLKGVSWVFDIAEVLSKPAPEDNFERVEFKCGIDDPHPNGLAGKAVADKFLSEYRKREKLL